MCGIVGYVGHRNVVDVIFKGLTNLEYRGYDSAGMALLDQNEIKVFKSLGKLINLKNVLSESSAQLTAPTSGIGHIRWATHGSPSSYLYLRKTCCCS